MNDDESGKKKRLIKLGAEPLAEALLELARLNETVEDLVERMIATPQENIRRYKAKLAGLKRRKRFISWRESGAHAHQLEQLLEDLKVGVNDPQAGVELVAAFYRADKAAFEQCDDSNGTVGDVFRFTAKELFIAYAKKCRDKAWLGELVFELSREDDYGVRDSLVDCAAEYLPEGEIRHLIKRFQATANQQADKYKKRHWLYQVESLARQIKDAPLFEKTRIAAWGKLSTAAFIDIAQVYLESDDTQTALSWLDRIPLNETYQANERDQLLLKIHSRRGDRDRQAEVAWRIFRRHRNSAALTDLLAVIGQGHKAEVIENEVSTILKARTLSLTDAGFLAEMGNIEALETYLIDRADQLNGDVYSSLLPLAEALESAARPLGAAVVYRALLDSILRRARTNTYAHGVRYLKKLDALSASIADWRSLPSHAVYKEQLDQKHGRKRSFWSRYNT